MAENTLPKKNAAYTFYVALVDTASRPDLKANPTLAAGDVQRSTDGAGYVNLTTLPVVTPAGGVALKVDLSAPEMNGDNVTVKFIDAAGAEWDDLLLEIRPATRKAEDLAFPTTSGRGLDVTAGGTAGVDWGNVENKTTANNLSATDIQICNTLTTYTGDTPQTGDNFARIGAPVGASISADLADVPTVSEFNARTILQASYFDPAADPVATVTTVTNQITSATMADAIWDEVLAGHVGADSAGLVLNEWQDGGRLDVLLDAIPTTPMRGTELAALASVATEARLAELDAANLPTDITTIDTVVGGIQTDLDNATDGLGALKALIDALNDVSTSDVLTQVNGAIDTAIAELGVAAPTATPTIRTGLMLLYMTLRNKAVVQTSGVDALEIYNNAGTKIAAKLLADDGNDFTEQQMA